MTADGYQLDRFVTAQESTYQRAVDELRRGRKTSHWMWFVFPQIAGLGYSATAQHYAISSLAEARAYLQHPVLGARRDKAEARFANSIDRFSRSRDAEECEAGLHLDTAIARKLAQNGSREFLAFDF